MGARCAVRRVRGYRDREALALAAADRNSDEVDFVEAIADPVDE
ncbi:hypothetical protein [Mycolicibacter sinensis]|nr:hypothetical protein [Mycolicibacter sinensis]